MRLERGDAGTRGKVGSVMLEMPVSAGPVLSDSESLVFQSGDTRGSRDDDANVQLPEGLPSYLFLLSSLYILSMYLYYTSVQVLHAILATK